MTIANDKAKFLELLYELNALTQQDIDNVSDRVLNKLSSKVLEALNVVKDIPEIPQEPEPRVIT